MFWEKRQKCLHNILKHSKANISKRGCWTSSSKDKSEKYQHALPLWTTLKPDQTYEVTVFRYSTTGNTKQIMGKRKICDVSPPLPFLSVLNPFRDHETRSRTQAKQSNWDDDKNMVKFQPVHRELSSWSLQAFIRDHKASYISNNANRLE